MKKYLFYIIGIVMTASFVSCEHKELCYDHSHLVTLNVAFDWQFAPEAAPKKMFFYLFPKEGSEEWKYELPNRQGGIVRATQGDYDLLCLNADSEVAMLRNVNHWDTYEVSTHSTSVLAPLSGVRSADEPRADGTENERVAFSPDNLWCSSWGDFSLALADEGSTVTLYPEGAIQTWTILIRNVSNLKYLADCSATLSGMAGGVLVASRRPSEELVTIPFGLTVRLEENLITGEVATFGHCPTNENKHQLVVYVVMKGGEKVYYTFDVTEQLHKSNEKDRLEIVIDGLSLPQPIVNGSGFHPEVDSWISVDIDIAM